MATTRADACERGRCTTWCAGCASTTSKERDHFSPYVTQDFEAYVARKRRDRTFNHVEIDRPEIYNRPVHMYDATGDAQAPMSTFSAASGGDVRALGWRTMGLATTMCSSTRSRPTWAVLKLPGLAPGLADRMQLEQARRLRDSALEAPAPGGRGLK